MIDDTFSEMGHCRICLKYRPVNRNKICEKCIETFNKRLPRVIHLIYDGRCLIPEESKTGLILSREDWIEIRRYIDAFYSRSSSDDIDMINREREEERENRQERKKRIHIPGMVYLMESDNGYYKIGRSINVEVRRDQIIRDYPVSIKIVHSFFHSDSCRAENKLHEMFSDKRKQGDWFKLSIEDVEFIRGITDEIARSLF